jgi:hypothetical protein
VRDADLPAGVNLKLCISVLATASWDFHRSESLSYVAVLRDHSGARLVILLPLFSDARRASVVADTVSVRFKTQLQELMKRVSATATHYIRCMYGLNVPALPRLLDSMMWISCDALPLQ